MDILVDLFGGEVPWVKIVATAGVLFVGGYFLIKSRYRVKTTRELCQLTLNSKDLQCNDEKRRDFCRFYKGKCIYIWTSEIEKPLQLDLKKTLDGGSMNRKELDTIIDYFLKSVQEYLPNAARNLEFVERMMPYLSTGPAMSYTFSVGPHVCMKDTRFIILVSGLSVRIINLGFLYTNAKKSNDMKILSPNLLTEPHQTTWVSRCNTFPDPQDVMSIIEQDLSAYQEVLKNNKWDSFIETKL